MLNKILFSFVLIILIAPAAMAQSPAGGLGTNSSEPVEISAENTLEWQQKEKQYVAKGAVEARQGDVTIKTDTLIADYRDDESGGQTKIWQLTATGNVIISNADTTATGDNAVYDVESGQATLTGKDLKLTMPEQIITASERMEYNSKQGTAKAVGSAKITKGTDSLSASTITANFADDASGKQVLKTADAAGGVTITTPDETLTGDTGKYNAASNTAEIMGNVKIVRGPNILEGARAEVNLTTNISKMFGAPESGKRVKGIFFPGSKK